MSGWETNLSRSPWKRADLTAPSASGLLFHPDNGSFEYIPTGRCQRSKKADLLLSPFRSPHAPCAVLVCFVRAHDEGAVCSKITIGAMLPDLLKRANFMGPGVAAVHRLRVESRSTAGPWYLVERLVEGRSSDSLSQR